MIIIGIVLLIIGLGTVLVAFRGRVVARGQFCKKCRFDLAGLDLEAVQAKCPECGSEIHHESARRGMLRRRSRVGLVVAAILFLAGSAGVLIGTTGKTSSIIAVMPDPIVLWLTDWGVDEALDELVVRVSKVPSTMSARSWDNAIEMGLAFQADTTLVWDVRWGEVLMISAQVGMMNNEQRIQYIAAVSNIDIEMRDEVTSGSELIDFKLGLKPNRGTSITGGQVLQRRVVVLHEVGVSGYTKDLSANGIAMQLPPKVDIPRQDMKMYSFKEYSSTLMRDQRHPQDGETLTVIVNAELRLLSEDGQDLIFSTNVHTEHAVRVLPDESEIVHRVDPLDAYDKARNIEAIAKKFSIPDIAVIKPVPDPTESNRYTLLLGYTFQQNQTITPIAYRVFFRDDSGEEFEIDTLVDDASTRGMSGKIQMVSYMQGNPTGNQEIQRAAKTMLNQGHATLVLRTAPSTAMGTSSIDTVLGLDLIFEDIPVVPSSPGKLNNSSTFGDGAVAAKPLSSD